MSHAGPQAADDVRAEALGWFRAKWDADLSLREWWQVLAESGWGFPTWPVEWYGRGLPAHLARAVHDARQEAGALGPPTGIAQGLAGPTLIAHGTDEQRRRFLPRIVGGEVWCQLFSEPGSGSDLASLQTRAVRDGDEWIITGQKVWTSGAQYSDIGEIICRTNPDAPKHKGLTGFVVDMHAPGVEVRPLRQMTGGASFNEVFFTEVRVPDDHRLGDVDQGWSVALTTLMNERAAIGGGGAGVGTMGTARLIEMLRYLGKDKDPVLRQQLADVYINGQVARYTNLRAMEKIKAGQLPGPEMSIGKLTLTQNMQRIQKFVCDALGPRITADTGEWGTFAWAEFVLGVPGMRVAGGTDEVMRNIVGERVLGLPKEPRVDV